MALRKAYKKLRNVQRNIAEAKDDDLMGEYLSFKMKLIQRVCERGGENEL